MKLPSNDKENLAVIRGVIMLAGALFIAYALYGYFGDRIAVYSGRGRGAGVGSQYVHGDQVALAALGYVSFAVAAFIGAGAFYERSASPVVRTSWRALFVIAFIVAGIILVGFRNPN